MVKEPHEDSGHSKLSASGWIALLVLACFLLFSLWYAVRAWTALSGVEMSRWGWTFLILGIVVTIAVGAGLMGLVFYSSRHDLDR